MTIDATKKPTRRMAALLAALSFAGPSWAQPLSKVTFKVDMTGVEDSDGAYVTGSFSGPPDGWAILPMTHEGDGVHSYRTELAPGLEGGYFFLRRNDWDARESVPRRCAKAWDIDRKYAIPEADVAYAHKYASCAKIMPPGSQAAAPEPDVVEEVVVTGSRRLFRDALEEKRSSEHIIEALSLEDIDSLPNVTIAEALVRLPGVNGTRDRGNQSQATIRGLGPRMVLGTVNGREVASSEPSRNIRWEQYPSELISRVQVYKTQSADMVSGGIAGTVNLDTVSPLAHDGPRYTLSAASAYYESGRDIPGYSPWGNRLSGTLVRTLGDNVGMALGLTSQTQKNAFPSYQGWGFNTPGSWQPDLPSGGGDLDGEGTTGYVPWGVQVEVGKPETERVGLLGALQFQPTDAIDVRYDSLYAEFDMGIDQDQTWYQGIGNQHDLQAGQYSDVVVVDDYALAATAQNKSGAQCRHDPFSESVAQCVDIRHVLARYRQKNSVFTQGLNADISVWEDIRVEADIAYSKAKRTSYWHGLYFDAEDATFSYDFRGRPSVSVPADSPSARPEAAALKVVDCATGFCGSENGNENQGSRLVDESWSYALAFAKPMEAADLTSVDFGIRYSNRQKEVVWEQFQMPRESESGQDTAVLSAIGFSSYTLPEIHSSPILTAPSFQAAVNPFGGIDYDLAAPNDDQYWKVSEDLVAAYVKANFEGDTQDTRYYTANVGVRAIRVDTKSFDVQGVWIGNDYTKLLPSASVNFFIDEQSIARLGVAKAMSRPPLDELRVGRLINAPLGTIVGNTGNPWLGPFTSTQIDLSYEWYFAPESLAAVTLFYKKLDDYIGYATLPIEGRGGRIVELTAPRNARDGYLRGFELTFQAPFTSLLPRSWRDVSVGIYSNYAFADSDILELYPVDNPFAMSGLAKHTAAVDLWLWWRGLDLRMGWKHHSDFTVGFGWDGSSLSRLDAETNVSASAAYRFNDNLSMRLQGWNLTDEVARTTRGNNDHDLRRFDVYGRGFFFDVTWKM